MHCTMCLSIVNCQGQSACQLSIVMVMVNVIVNMFVKVFVSVLVNY